MKKLFATLTLFSALLSYSTFAQTDAKAKSVLDGLSRNAKSLRSLKANFAIAVTGANGKVVNTQRGTFYMKGPKFRISMPQQEIVSDNKSVWAYTKETNEVQISKYDPNEAGFLSPAKIFSDFSSNEFNYRYVGAQTVNKKACDVVELTPKKANDNFKKIELSVDSKTKTIVSGRAWEKSGNQYRYDVTGFTPNAPLSDAQFAFDTKQHPGVEVVDLR